MPERNMAYFEATGELLLDFMKQISSGIPEDAELIRVETVPARFSPLNEPLNIMRFIIESKSFDSYPEGAQIPRISPVVHKP